MKKIYNFIAVLAIIAGLALSVIARWWVVWLVAFPLLYAGAIYLLKEHTDFIEKY